MEGRRRIDGCMGVKVEGTGKKKGKRRSKTEPPLQIHKYANGLQVGPIQDDTETTVR